MVTGVINMDTTWQKLPNDRTTALIAIQATIQLYHNAALILPKIFHLTLTTLAISQ